MLNDWSHKVRAILKKYCPGNIKKILPSSQSAWNTRFYFGHQKLCMDNNSLYSRLCQLHLFYTVDFLNITDRATSLSVTEFCKNTTNFTPILYKLHLSKRCLSSLNYLRSMLSFCVERKRN